MKISYKLIDHIDDNIDKEKIINIFNMLQLMNAYELKKFIKEKYKKENIYNSLITQY